MNCSRVFSFCYRFCFFEGGQRDQCFSCLLSVMVTDLDPLDCAMESDRNAIGMNLPQAAYLKFAKSLIVKTFNSFRASSAVALKPCKADTGNSKICLSDLCSCSLSRQLSKFIREEGSRLPSFADSVLIAFAIL